MENECAAPASLASSNSTAVRFHHHLMFILPQARAE
jgi:hypothetical protein